MKKSLLEASLGFSVHTGWAAMIAVAGPPKSPVILDRRRIDMMGNDPDKPRFVYHYAAERLTLSAAERFVREAIEQSRAKAVAALEAAVTELAKKKTYDVVASGIIVGNRPLKSTLADILKSHSLIHTAEGELFRVAIKGASERAEDPRQRDSRSRSRSGEPLKSSTYPPPQSKCPRGSM